MSDVAEGAYDLVDHDPDPSEHSGRSRGRGTIITLTTVVALVIATGLTVLGLGSHTTAVANFDASSWLFSAPRGEVDRVNGVTAKVDTRARIKDAQNHEIEVTQTDKYLILRDLDTGQVSTLDLTTLQTSAVMPTTPGLGVRVALNGDVAFVVDSVQGRVRQLDPRTLSPVGEAIALPNGVAAGGFDGQGTLWVAVPKEGTVVGIVAGAAGAGPHVLRTVTVAPPGHDLVVSALDEGVAVLDNTDQSLARVHGETVASSPVPAAGPGTMPARTGGTAVPVTVSDDRRVIVLDGTAVTNFTVPGAGPLAPAVAFAGHVYVADSAAGIVFDFDAAGRLVNQIHISAAGGKLELEVREDHLFINAPNGSTARVVDSHHVVREVNKYQQGVLGADPPPPAPPASQPPKPVVTVPGRPQNVAASAGDKTAHVTWRKAAANGAPITKYVVTGAGQTITVGANQRSADIGALTNAKTYTFTVHAVNAKGAGPDATSPPVTPTADVPDPPGTPVAVANPDGSVQVTWPAANGQGRKITRYSVTAIAGGAQPPIGDVTVPTILVPAGGLDYGTQVAFSVVAINDRGAGSTPSPVSNIVVPFTRPGPVTAATATTVGTQKGAVSIQWQAAQSNGSPITGYVVKAGTTSTTVTATSVVLAGFGDDQAVTATVHAVNLAGAGPDATATARTIGQPTVTVTSSASGYNSVSVTFTPNNKGGAATCRVQVAGAGVAQAACTTQPLTLTVGGLWPNTTYGFTVSVITPAGTASGPGSKATSQLRATVLCGDVTYCGSGIYLYSTPNNGNPVNSVGSFTAGIQFVPVCHVASDNVDARPWGGRNSNQWLRVVYKGSNAYFPFAWVNTDGGNNLSLIRPC